MTKRRGSFKLRIPLEFGPAKTALEVETDLDWPMRRPFGSSILVDPERVLELVEETSCMLAQGDLAGAAGRALVLAAELSSSERVTARANAAAAAALLHDLSTDAIAPAMYRTERTALFTAIAQFIEDARTRALGSKSNTGRQQDSGQGANGSASLESISLTCSGLGWSISASQTILHDISFDLHRGEILGLVGPNGAGKTSLLRLLAGSLSPTAGQIKLPYLSQRGATEAQIADLIGYVPQRPTAFVGSVVRCLELYARLHGLDIVDSRKELAYVVQRMGLARYSGQSWKELSAGYRTRFALAQSLLGSPHILLLDEPFAPLDAQSRREYITILEDLARSGRRISIVVASHDLDALGGLADRVVFLAGGTIAGQGTLAELRKHVPGCLFRVRGSLAEAFAERCRVNDPPFEVLKLGADTIELKAERPVHSALVLSWLLETQCEVIDFRDLSYSIEVLMRGREGHEPC